MALVTLACVLGVATEQALADVGGPAMIERSVVAELLSSSNPAPGVTARVLPGPVPGILLDATASDQTIVVLGAAGEPYVRLGPRGAEVNLRSPAQRGGAASGGRALDPRAAPRWRRIAPVARYAWLEARARPQRLPAITDTRRRTLLTWRVPLDVGGRRTELRGATSWVPPAGVGARDRPEGILSTFGVPIAVLALLSVVAVAALVAFGRRTRRSSARAQRTR